MSDELPSAASGGGFKIGSPMSTVTEAGARRSLGEVAFLLHFREREDSVLLTESLERCRQLGLTPVVAQADPDRVIGELRDLRLVVSVGGDGTFLYAARMAAPRGVPLLGVNRGQLGFLCSVEMEQLPDAVAAFAAGQSSRLARSTLSATVESGGDGEPVLVPVAVNEVLVRAEGFNLIRMRLRTDHQLVGDFDADGLIVSTSIGSTAYSLSAGGPSVDPAVPALVITPLNPHAMSNRSLVVPNHLEVRVEVVRGAAVLAADGRPWARLEEGDRVRIGRGPALEMVQPPGTAGFYERLRSKTGFGTVLKLAPQEDEGEPATALPPEAQRRTRDCS